MPDIITPSGLPTELTTGLVAEDLIELYNSVRSQNEKVKFKNMFLAGLYLDPDCIAFQEKLSGSLTVSGWYTIARLLPVNNNGGSCEIIVTDKTVGRAAGVKIYAISSTSPKTLGNTTLELMGGSGTSSDKFISDVQGFRLAKSDSVGDAGIKVQVLLNPPTARIYSVKIDNTGRASGFELVTPVLDDETINPGGQVILPDGVTPATFIEAGAEYNLDNPASFLLPIHCIRVTADGLRCSVEWPEIPKSASNISLDLGGASITPQDGVGNTGAVLSGFTISNFAMIGKTAYFIINQVGVGTGIADKSLVGLYAVGGAPKLTLI